MLCSLFPDSKVLFIYKSLLSHLAQLHGGDAAPTISVKEGENILVLSQLCLGQPLSGLVYVNYSLVTFD